MIERKDEVVIRADLPRLEQKDIQVTMDNGMLTIKESGKSSGARRRDAEEDYYCCELLAHSDASV